MEYTQEQIDKIEEMASLLFKISDIARMINVDNDQLRHDITYTDSIVSRKYYLSKLKVICKLRKQEIEQAELGSNTAIELVSKYINEQKFDE